MDDLIREFLVESCENIDRVDRELVELEKRPDDRDTLASIFRAVHSIKGACGFLGFGQLESVAHVGENLLSKLRDGELRLDGEMTNSLLALVDAIRQMLALIETSGSDAEASYHELKAELQRLLQGAPAVQDSNAAESEEAPPMAPLAQPSAVEPTPNIEDDRVFAATGNPSVAAAQAPVEAAATTPHETPSRNAITALANTGPAAPSAADNNIRVGVHLLDALMNLVGELVLARNQILQYTADADNLQLTAASQRLNLITTELQEGVMKTRMQPIGNIWSKFPRVVRDTAAACGKKVRIDMEGQETELDKTIIEAIKDPLTHIIRNSIDHGVESPDARTAAGKSAEGRVLMRAYHEGGQVNIEIADDGAGINVDRVKRKAVEKALITADHAARMGDREAVNLVFLPGFSTAEKVTNVSGRGVGMDVVRTNIEKIGGTIELLSVAGQGTTMRIKIPLTLAIIPALMVRCGGERFAIPQLSLVELVRMDGDAARQGIENLHGSPVYRLRGNLLPLVFLSQVLELRRPNELTREALNIVVLQADGRQFGLVVDDVTDTGEIVVKPLSSQLRNVAVFAGATILGDGHVALILDVAGLSQRAGMTNQSCDNLARERFGNSAAEQGGEQELLLIELESGCRAAIPLSSVARLEEFPRRIIERAGGQQVVQYRGQILPLVSTAEVFGCGGYGDGSEREYVHVVVYIEHGRSAGLMVEHIVDIVRQQMQIDWQPGRPGVLGRAVIQDRVAEILDLPAILASTDAGSQAEPVFG